MWLSILRSPRLPVLLSKADERFHYLQDGHVTRVRGGIVALQLHKLHSLTDQDAKEASVSSTINTNIDAICADIRKLILAPIAVCEFGLGISLLSYVFDAPTTAICLPLIIATLINFLLGRYMFRRVQDWEKNTKTRVTASINIFRQTTAVKMLGLGPVVGTFLHNLRDLEARATSSYQYFNLVYNLALTIASFGVRLVVLAIADYAGHFSGEMPVVKAFGLLSIAYTLNFACVVVLQSCSEFVTLANCFFRNGETFKQCRAK